MSIQWGDYEPFQRLQHGLTTDMQRRDAVKLFESIMEAIPERVRTVIALLERNGIECENTDACLMRIENWFRKNVESRSDQSDRMTSDWYCVVFDLGILLGQYVIERHPQLHWELKLRPKSDLSYQHHVISGFNTTPGYVVNFDGGVAMVGHQAIIDEVREGNLFVKWFANASRLSD